MAINPSSPHHLLFVFVIIPVSAFSSYSVQEQPSNTLQTNQCGDKCGDLDISFPFYVNSSCASLSDAFNLSCLNSTSLYLTIGSQSYKVLRFFSDGILVDFPNTSLCRQYNDLRSFGFQGNQYFGISTDNVVGLYDCEDSSLCKADCEKSFVPGCDGNANGYTACCYPLSDHSAWHIGDGFSVFSQFGCRGFSSWIVLPGSVAGKRGVKLEWAIPTNSTKGDCAPNSITLNSTSVTSGKRCQCQDGFVGDGFAHGTGCLKFCFKDGNEAYGKDCYEKSHGRRKTELLAGVLTSAFTIASLLVLFCLLKRPIKSDTFNLDQNNIQSTMSLRKHHRTELFTHHELEEATKGFDDTMKLHGGANGTLYAGVLKDGSNVAVDGAQCDTEGILIQVLSRVEVLSAISHKNIARILGWSSDSGNTALVVYAYPANGTLKEHLRQSSEQNIGLNWCKRLRIATQIASTLAFLQCEIYPPIFHHNLQSGSIFIDKDCSIKIAGFELINSSLGDDSHGSRLTRSDVYSLGLMLLEIIAGARHLDLQTIALQKIQNGNLEEIVDPLLYNHEQHLAQREQIEGVADLATRCLLFGGYGKLGMVDVTRELMHINKSCLDGSCSCSCSRRGPSLEETFSNSSLLQMISMSPDSIHVP